MKKLLLLALSVILLSSTVCLFSASAEEDPFHCYVDGVVTFETYTKGAEAAFDGKEETTFAGNAITGKFATRTVLTGIKITTPDEIVGCKVLGSEDGLHWTLLYEDEPTKKYPMEFGSVGDPAATYSADMLNHMYTYAWNFLRITTEEGEIAEVTMAGYAVGITGKLMALDTTYGTNGANESLSNYSPSKLPFIIDHIVGANWETGEVVKPDSEDPDKNAWMSVKLASPTVISEIAFTHRSKETTENALKRFNGLYFEASKDGEKWKTLVTTPQDFTCPPDQSPKHNLNTYCICSIDIDDTEEYQYVRVRTDANSGGKGWLQLAELEVYGKVEKLLPDDITSVVNYGVKEEPEEEDPTTGDVENPGQEKEPEVNDPEEKKPEEGGEEKKGCGSVLGVCAILPAMIFGAAAVIGRKKED